MTLKLFLGGTCAPGDDYREKVIPMLQQWGIDYFNPAVPDWDKAHQEIENLEKEICSHLLFLITPHQQGYYSIAEVVEQAMLRKTHRPNTVLFAVYQYAADGRGFSCDQIKSFDAIAGLIAQYKANSVFKVMESAMMTELNYWFKLLIGA